MKQFFLFFMIQVFICNKIDFKMVFVFLICAIVSPYLYIEAIKQGIFLELKKNLYRQV